MSYSALLTLRFEKIPAFAKYKFFKCLEIEGWTRVPFSKYLWHKNFDSSYKHATSEVKENIENAVRYADITKLNVNANFKISFQKMRHQN